MNSYRPIPLRLAKWLEFLVCRSYAVSNLTRTTSLANTYKFNDNYAKRKYSEEYGAEGPARRQVSVDFFFIKSFKIINYFKINVSIFFFFDFLGEIRSTADWIT